MPIRELTSFDELKAVEELQRIVWGASDIDILAPLSLRASIAAGNLLLGAFDNNQIVGFMYGFLGYLHGQVELHSDMTGIIPSHRDRGLGYQLKLHQRAWALKRGIKLVTWTFDPLRSRNAYFNFHKLGATSNSYRVNFYGEDSTSFLHQNSTDRLWVTWELESERVNKRLNGDKPDTIEAPFQVKIGRDGEPESHPNEAPQIIIEIPRDADAMAIEQSRRWRAATREAFLEKLAAGYVVTDAKEGRYLLTRPVERP